MSRFFRGFVVGSLFGVASSNTALCLSLDVSRAPEVSTEEYDLVVIGGGSGGLAAARASAKHGARVCVYDYVQPSETRGSVWGLGGTCVNVGCIPKKLMHQAALVGSHLATAHAYGWEERPMPVCQWEVLKQNVTDYIRSLNFGYRMDLMSAGISYVNSYARFVDARTLSCTDAKGKHRTIRGNNIIIATGCRPRVPQIPGAQELGITSDDLFLLEKDPQKTLIVGGGYVALECAGFLHGIGRDVTVMVRSTPLRGFDQDMATRLVKHMKDIGIRFISGDQPTSLTAARNGMIEVTSSLGSDQFNTVLFATGRAPQTNTLGLDTIGIDCDADGRIITDAYDRTSVQNVYAIGDVVSGGRELTPVAIRAGQYLADRLFGGGTSVIDTQFIPTTVFSPLEYACVGYSESFANAHYPDNIEVFHSNLIPLEWALPHHPTDACYTKMIVHTPSDRVIGYHILSPNAGEIAQSVAVALRCGAKKSDFDATIGIHPTIAEEMTRLSVTKKSGISPEKKGC